MEYVNGSIVLFCFYYVLVCIYVWGVNFIRKYRKEIFMPDFSNSFSDFSRQFDPNSMLFLQFNYILHEIVIRLI